MPLIGVLMPTNPKDPSVRQRRNKTSTNATLKADPDIEVPGLPKRGGWHEQTVAWWADVWASPMAPEYDDSDKHGLFALAVLVDDFWTAKSARERKELAAEMRQQSQRFGLSPIDRRRLQWTIEQADEAQDKGERRRAKAQPAQSSGGSDPRATLRAV
jgi:hypothetical protein